MFKNLLESLAGVEVYGIISLTVFVSVFVAMLVVVFRSSKKHVEYMAQLPLDDENAAAKSQH